MRLTAEAIPLSEFERETISLTPDIHYHAERISHEEREAVEKGLLLIAASIRATISAPIMICLVDIDYNPCDYQPEGITCAMMEWSAQEFGFTPPTIPVFYDKASNCYHFNFEEAKQAGNAGGKFE